MDAPDPRLVQGLRLTLAREWFEAHEALEPVWQEAPPGERRDGLQGLIQHLVALEHLRRGNALGAFNVWSRAKAKLKSVGPWLEGIGLGPWSEALEGFYRDADLADRVRLQLEGGVASEDLGPREGRAALPDLPPPEAWPVPPLSAELAAYVAGD